MKKEKSIDRNTDSKLISEEIYKILNKRDLTKYEFELEKILDLIDELKSSYPALNYYFLYNITLADIHRIVNEHDSSIEFDLTISEPVTANLIIDEPDIDSEDKKEKSILLLLVLLLFLEQSHFVLNIKFKNNKNKFLIPFQSYFSFLSRNSILVTSNYKQNFSYVMSVESCLNSYCSKNYYFYDHIDRSLQKKLNKTHLNPDSLLNYPVATDLQKHKELHSRTMKISESLARKLAMNIHSIFKLDNKIRLY